MFGVWLFFGYSVGQEVCCTAKPAQDLVVKGFDIVEGTVVKEVHFDVFDHILDLSFAFRIGFPAEVQAEGLFARISPERIGEDNVPAVFADHEHLILVIDNF